MMNEKASEELVQQHGIRPTANRIMIVRALAGAGQPLSMIDLENKLLTIDKSGIYRSLVLFRQKGLVYALEDGSGEMKYEFCRGKNEEESDRHVHFFCEQCRQTYCMEEIAIPEVTLREGFLVHSINYMVKGLCPQCVKKRAKCLKGSY